MRCMNDVVLVLVLVVTCAVLASGCGVEAASGDEKLVAVATIGMIEDTVRKVGGERLDVVGLIGSGVDPHLFKPTRSDVQRLIDADVIFYNGLLLEGRMVDSFERAGSSGIPVHGVNELLGDEYLLEPDEFEGHYDPHVWMDPRAWAVTVDVVRDALIELDPEGEAEYRENAERYRREIEALDAYAAEVLGSVPEGQQVLVTAHDAFNYFGRRYGFDVVGIQGISTESEAGVRDIERLVDMLVERQIGAVFVESTVSERNINQLVAGAAARGHTVAIGGELFSDAMGDAGTYEGTYIGMIDHNVTTIARALGGSAPSGGFHGKLSDREAR